MKNPRVFPDPLSGDQASLAALDLLSTAVLLLDQGLVVRYANSAAQNLLASPQQRLLAQPLNRIIDFTAGLQRALENAADNNWSYTGHNIEVRRDGREVMEGVDGETTSRVDCTVSPLELEDFSLLLELRPIDKQIKVRREERLIEQQIANRELIRNLAHEIKNPLGGIRGAAQLLEHELNNPGLREYTQVIIKEADRLQDLMQRLLSPHRTIQPGPLNLHEVLERVRSLLLAEYPGGLLVRRDYDTSLPELKGDREQLIQAILNIARNAAQAMEGHGELVLRTRAVRQVTLVKRRRRLAIELQVIDNGPGIPEEIRERMFYPLVSGREGGSGLGLTLAQSFIQQHQGSIDCESRPGRTCFNIRLPIDFSNEG